MPELEGLLPGLGGAACHRLHSLAAGPEHTRTIESEVATLKHYLQ